MKIAVLSINIGKYICFWKRMYESAEENFLPEVEKDYFVFTEKENYDYCENGNVHTVFQEDLGWPDNTLMRYQMFLSIEEQLKKYDYIYFFNSNLLFVERVGKEVLPLKERLVCVQRRESDLHKRRRHPYERNPKSFAYVSYEEDGIYARGGFYGGTAEAFLDMCHTLNRNINKDKEDGIIAIWHDESHIARYMLGRKDVKALPASYLYPEGCVMPYRKHIVVRKKNNSEIRFGSRDRKNDMIGKIKLSIRNCVYSVLIVLHIIKFDKNS